MSSAIGGVGRKCIALAVALALSALLACDPKVYPAAASEVRPSLVTDIPPVGTIQRGGDQRSADAGDMADGTAPSATEQVVDSAVEPIPDAGSSDASGSLPVPDAGCTPRVLFRDRDGDGFGSTAQDDLEFGCPPLEGYATVTGDCHDVEPSELDPADQVFPGQGQFFGSPYPTANGLSFDYDCSENEVAEPHPDFVAARADCEQQESCAGLDIGYLPAEPRAGQNVNVLCGSTDSVTCSGSGTGCALIRIRGFAFRCH